MIDELTREPEPELRVSLYRIVQEAVANARKHAGARRVSVRVTHRGDGVTVLVTDDGAGFDTGTVDTPVPGPPRARDDDRARRAGGRLVPRDELCRRGHDGRVLVARRRVSAQSGSRAGASTGADSFATTSRSAAKTDRNRRATPRGRHPRGHRRHHLEAASHPVARDRRGGPGGDATVQLVGERERGRRAEHGRPVVVGHEPAVGTEPRVVVGLSQDRGERAEVVVGEPGEVGGDHDVRRVLEAIVVVDRAPDVEQGRGVGEHLPQAVATHAGSSAVIRSAARPARRSAAAAFQVRNRDGEGRDRDRAHPLGRGRARSRRREREPLAQPSARDDDLRCAQVLGDAVDHERAADDRVGAIGVQPGDLRASLHRAAGELVDHVAEPLVGEPVAVQQGQRVVGAAQVDLREVPHRAADADELVARSRSR